MFRFGDELNRCIQFNFVDMAREGELGAYCQRLDLPGSFFESLEASPCPSLNWVISNDPRYRNIGHNVYVKTTVIGTDRPHDRVDHQFLEDHIDQIDQQFLVSQVGHIDQIGHRGDQDRYPRPTHTETITAINIY